MRALLDTHTFLWWITDRPQLSARVGEIIGDGSNELFLSADPQIARYPVKVIW